MKLQDTLPRGVTVGGRFYRMDLDFRNVLKLMDTLAREDLMPQAREYVALKCVMKRPPRNAGQVLAALRHVLFPEAQKKVEQKKITDFEQDADLIRAAFMQVYGISLYRDRLHWVEFSALLAGLPEGNRYSEILGIRARPMPKATKVNAEERQWLAQAKATYALKMTDQEREQSYQTSMRRTTASLLALAKRGENKDA